MSRPIGVFDSGLGGLTVVRALREQLPGEHIVYLGDTARLPYGNKSAATVTQYSLKAAQFLLGRHVKIILVACNTASASALPALVRGVPAPVLGAVGPGAEVAAAATRSGRVGVLATLTTVRSQAYPQAIAALDSRIRVEQMACPLFVPLVEEGWLGVGPELETAAANAVARRYLGVLRENAPDLDVLVLGCTHYPLLADLIRRVSEELWQRELLLVDSAQAMVRATAHLLEQMGLRGNAGGLDCYLTDEARFAEVGSRFLGMPLERIERVDLA